MTQSTLDIINSIASRLEADLKRYQQIEEILKQNPQVLEQVPELKTLIRFAA